MYSECSLAWKHTNDKAKLRTDGNAFMFYLYEKWQLNNKSALALSNFITVWAADLIS